METLRLNSRIKIITIEEGENEFGEQRPVEAELRTIWASVQPRTGSLLSGRPADTMLSRTTHAIFVRAESAKDITVDNYIIWNDAVATEHRFSIDYILPPAPGQQFTTIYASERI